MTLMNRKGIAWKARACSMNYYNLLAVQQIIHFRCFALHFTFLVMAHLGFFTFMTLKSSDKGTENMEIKHFLLHSTAPQVQLRANDS